MSGPSSNRPRAGAERPLLIVLNNDAVICEGCYEPQNLEVDPGLIPWARIASGQCSCCGAEVEDHARGARASG